MPPKILNINLFCGLAIFINSSLFCHHIERMICYRMAFSISNLQVLCELFRKIFGFIFAPWKEKGASLKPCKTKGGCFQPCKCFFSTLHVFFFFNQPAFSSFIFPPFANPQISRFIRLADFWFGLVLSFTKIWPIDLLSPVQSFFVKI